MVVLFNSEFRPRLMFPNITREEDEQSNKTIKAKIRINDLSLYPMDKLNRATSDLRYLLNKETGITYKINMHTLLNKGVYADLTVVMKPITKEDEEEILAIVNKQVEGMINNAD